MPTATLGNFLHVQNVALDVCGVSSQEERTRIDSSWEMAPARCFMKRATGLTMTIGDSGQGNQLLECPVYIPYCFKYICELISGISPSLIWSLLGLGCFRVEGAKSIEKWLILFFPFFPALRARSSHLGWSIVGQRGMCIWCCGDVPCSEGWS